MVKVRRTRVLLQLWCTGGEGAVRKLKDTTARALGVRPATISDAKLEQIMENESCKNSRHSSRASSTRSERGRSRTRNRE